MRCVNCGLRSYNKYLRRRLKLEIKAYSKFAYANTAEKNDMLQSVCESLESTDRLKLARYLPTLSKIPDTELFLIESPLEKLKIIGTFLAAAIPIVISVIQLIKGQ